jgi:ribonuclease E
MGTIRSVESLSLAILRLIGEEARKERSARIFVQVPVDVGTYLMNEKREWLNTVSQRSGVEVIVIPNPNLQTPNYSIRRVRDDEAQLPENTATSYQMVEQEQLLPESVAGREKKPPAEAPAVPTVLPTAPAPVSAITPVSAVTPAAPTAGIFVRLWRWLFGAGAPAVERPGERRPEREHRRPFDERRHRRDRDSRRENRGGERHGHARHGSEGGSRREHQHAARRDPRAPVASSTQAQEAQAPRERQHHEPVRAESARPERADRPERAERTDRAERGGRGRRGRRRRRGGREGGEAREGATPGPNGSEATREAGAAPEARQPPDAGGESQPHAPAEVTRNPELPFSGEPHHVEAPRSPAPVAPHPDSSAQHDKFVVWSSGPTDSSAHGPGRDD